MSSLASLISALALAAASGVGDAPPQLAEARALLAGGKAAEALAMSKEGLERAPDLAELLDLASQAAAGAGASDEALWYGALAQAQLAENPSPSKAERALADALLKRLLEIDPVKQQGPAALAEYTSALLAIGKDCAGRKLYVNAVDLLGRCRGTAAAAAAEAELARIYANKKAVEALLASGLDVPVKERKKRSPEVIAREDAKHSTWETAWEVKGEQYTIKTDMGLEIAQQMSLAMEQMNGYYRRVFHVKEFGGGQTARFTICVYRTRAEFDEHEKVNGESRPPEVKGFCSPIENRVCTYDPRTDGNSLAFLWQTLFHEASHQFTYLMAPHGEVPTWLNEGTASYFEGARLLPNGRVETNLVAEERLETLKHILDEGKPTLKEVVSYFKPGSYPGEYYYPGWGLAYFLQNYEDERSQRVYLKPYQDFMAIYGKSAGRHDVLGRFVEYFVTRPKQPGVETFEDFENRWKDWILRLHTTYFGGPEVADDLIARARKQVVDKAYDAAEESFAWALRKRPGDPVASFELAELLAAQKKSDPAMFRYRAAVEELRKLDDPSEPLPGSEDLTGKDLLEISQKQLAKLDKSFSEAKAKADADFAADVEAAAREYSEKKLPLTSLRLLDEARALYGESSGLSALRDEIAKASGADTRRWRRLPAAGELVEWEAEPGWTSQAGVLAADTEDPTFCMWREKPPERYTFEARIDATGLDAESGFVGMCFGENEKGLQFAGFSAGGPAEYGKLEQGWKRIGPLPSIRKDQLGSILLRIEVSADSVEFFLGGKSAGKPKKYDPEDLAGRIGFVVQGGQATVRDVRLCY